MGRRHMEDPFSSRVDCGCLLCLMGMLFRVQVSISSSNTTDVCDEV